MNYDNIAQIIIDSTDQLKPPERITPAEAAEKYRNVYSPGSYIGPWRNDTTPYMIEPMNVLSSRDYVKAAFCGPAQSGKTDAIIINGVAYSVVVDPLDTMVFCPTNTAARDFSIRRIDRLHQHSPEVGRRLLAAKDADNTFDKRYKSGMILTLSWPSVTELAGRPVGRVIITDYDRIPDDIGGDGNAFDLASQRTNTFGKFAMCYAESSPSRPVIDPRFILRGAHEAPPCTGILDLYNRGDRRRWYWPCPHCNGYFEGDFKLLQYEMDPLMSNLEKAKTVRMVCPHCGSEISPDDRYEMNTWATWIPEGMHLDSHGILKGKRRKTDFASWWLKGTAAAFTTWTKLVVQYLDAEDVYRRTLSEESLKKFYNNDLGEPYVSKDLTSMRVPETMTVRAEQYQIATVPPDVRLLIGTVDVQKNSFICHITGISPGQPFDVVLIDRFKIQKSNRLDSDGDPMILEPHVYEEDWELLNQVIDAKYPLADGSGRMMKVKMTACDSGGMEGVTTNAYAFWKKQRKAGNGGRFMLVKGDPNVNAPRTRISFPDSQRKTAKNLAHGDIPVLMINTNVMKDTLSGRLDCIEPGKGMVHYPVDMPEEFYKELCAEVRTERGWEKKQKRNEAFDLLVYAYSVAIAPKILGLEAINWESPPSWADSWDKNPMVVTLDADDFTIVTDDADVNEISKLAEMLA